MRVLIWSPNQSKVAGGHLVQREKTAAALRDIGVDVTLSSDPDQDLDGFDVLHSFSCRPPDLRRCREAGMAICVSTIQFPRYDIPAPTTFAQRLADWRARARMAYHMTRHALAGRGEQFCDQVVASWNDRRVELELADVLLPNSESEGLVVANDMKVSTPFHVVPNAVDPDLFQLDGPATYPGRRYVMSAGRIEPHKNQLGLIQAMKGTGIPLLLVGPRHPDHDDYLQACKRAASPDTIFVPELAHQSMLAPLYRSAKVHVLASDGETTGLASLEAALCGCNIATTSRGFARDYFGDLAWYLQYNSARSIRDAVLAAYNAPYRPELRDKILNNYTWEHTARATLAGYEKALALRNPRRALAEI